MVVLIATSRCILDSECAHASFGKADFEKWSAIAAAFAGTHPSAAETPSNAHKQSVQASDALPATPTRKPSACTSAVPKAPEQRNARTPAKKRRKASTQPAMIFSQSQGARSENLQNTMTSQHHTEDAAEHAGRRPVRSRTANSRVSKPWWVV